MKKLLVHLFVLRVDVKTVAIKTGAAAVYAFFTATPSFLLLLFFCGSKGTSRKTLAAFVRTLDDVLLKPFIRFTSSSLDSLFSPCFAALLIVYLFIFSIFSIHFILYDICAANYHIFLIEFFHREKKRGKKKAEETLRQ